MSIKVAYDARRVWGYKNQPRADYRPYEEITVVGPKQSERIFCLVDSGADQIQLPDYVAHNVGFNLNRDGNPVHVLTAAGGTVPLVEIANVEVEIEGYIIHVDCLFGSSQTPLLGRTALLKALDFGFDVNGWLLKL